MRQFQVRKVFAALLLCLAGITLVQKNAGAETPKRPPQGSTHVLLEVDTEAAAKDAVRSLFGDVRRKLRWEMIHYSDLTATAKGVTVRIIDFSQIERARRTLHFIAPATDVVVIVDHIGRASLTFADSVLDRLRAHAMDETVEIVRKRINPEGRKDIEIQRQGTNRISVTLPRGQNPQDIIRRAQTPANLTFHLVDDSVSPADIEKGHIPKGTKVLRKAIGRASSTELVPIVVEERVLMLGAWVRKAEGALNPESGRPVVALKFDAPGASQFARVTKDNIGKRFAAVLDGKVITAPVIRSPIIGGDCIIEGDFTLEEAKEIAVLLNAGALPVSVRTLEPDQVQ